jgi:hypothetical protein
MDAIVADATLDGDVTMRITDAQFTGFLPPRPLADSFLKVMMPSNIDATVATGRGGFNKVRAAWARAAHRCARRVCARVLDHTDDGLRSTPAAGGSGATTGATGGQNTSSKLANTDMAAATAVQTPSPACSNIDNARCKQSDEQVKLNTDTVCVD